MIITCKACNTSFNLDDKMLKPAGSKVRCSVCANVFTAFPQQAPAPEAAADVPEPEQAPQTEAASESDLAAAAAIPPVEQDTSAAADAADVQPPETNVLEEDTDALLEEGTDLDFALEDEPEEDLSDVEIEDAVSGVLDEDLSDLVTEPESDDGRGAADIASLDDDDLSLDLSPENVDEDETAAAY
jgi:pilus assembly protein FimV